MDGKNGIEEMRVQDSVICAKMTEERSKNGVSEIASGKTKTIGEGGSGIANGALSPKLIQSTESDVVRAPGGGRLKFFKDGKLIFELSHRKEGERTSWVPVPKKTFWPPPCGGGGALVPAMAVAGTSRQESSTSLSVSDDNSSIQSSPWQRDHCWKQQNPRRDLGKELTFVMQPRPRVRWLRRRAPKAILRKRRRPLDPLEITWEDCDKLQGLVFKAGKNKNAKGKLLSIIDRLVSSAVEVTSKPPVPSCSRMDPSLVSPRKRILRDLERVSLEDQASKRHKRPSALLKSPSPPSVCVPGSSTSSHSTTAIKTKGNFNVPSSTPSPPSSYGCNTSPSVSNNNSGKTKVEKLGSYSINSLLGKSDSDPVVSNEPSFLRSLLKSPSRTTGGSDLVSVGGSSSPSSVIHSPQPCQSPPETRWSRPHKKKLASPDTQCASLRLTNAPAHPPSLPPPHHTTGAPSHHLSPTHFLSPQPPHLFHSLGFLPPPPPSLMSTHYYSPYPPSRTPLWSHPTTAASLHYSGLLPLQPWSHAPLGPPTHPQQPLLVDPGKREELAADMPLNLSKHAG